MNKIYVIKESMTNFPVASALDEGTAKVIVNNMNNSANGFPYFNYILVPFFYEGGTIINIIAPPISKEYLPATSDEDLNNMLQDEHENFNGHKLI